MGKILTNKEFDNLTRGVFKLQPGIKLFKITGKGGFAIGGALNAIAVRSDGAFKDKVFFLDDQFEWRIIEDEEDNLCLVPFERN